MIAFSHGVFFSLQTSLFYFSHLAVVLKYLYGISALADS